jgi:hypothetical protein
MRDGITYGELINTLALAVGDFNEQMAREWGWCFSLTEDLMVEYGQGGSVTDVPEITDIDDLTVVHGQTIGHMIDFKHYGLAVGSSAFYLRDARSTQIEESVSDLIRSFRFSFEKKLLTRWFTNTENAIGAAGYDVPFVRGAGGNVDFAPPAFDGEAFTTSHDHYLGVDDTSLDPDDALNAMGETLAEHGHAAPYTALVAKADVTAYQALTKFVQIVDPVISTIDRGGGSSGNEFFAVGSRPFGLLGYFQSDWGLIEVRFTNRVPTTFAGMMKSYGTLDRRNGLAVRVHPSIGFGAYLVSEMSMDNEYPIKTLGVINEYGIGVGRDRTNGVVSKLVAGGAWGNPIIA